VTLRKASLFLLSFLAATMCGANLNAQSIPTLAVDATASQHAINPNIYGIANYGLDATYAEEIQVPNIRWGGDGTTRYNWQVDSSNSGFDWYFMGGNGNANPVPSASVDLMVNTYKLAHAGALITIPVIPYVNSTSAWTCSFPTSVYGAQQSTNPYVHPNGENCGNSISSSGNQLLDTNIYANHIANSVALQQGWLEHLVATFGTAAKGGVPFYQLDNEPGGWGNTHRDVEPNGATYNTIISLGQQYAATVKQVDPSAMVLGPSDFTLGGWIGTPSQQNNLYAGQYYLQQMAAYDQKHGERVLDYFDEHYYPQFTDPISQLASTRTFWDPTYNGGTWVEQYYFDGPMQLIPRFQQWIAQYYPGTKLSFSEYSIDSGNKLVTDALAEADVLGIFGFQRVDFANMWNAPGPTDPIAYSFRLYRNYDGQGGQFGNTSVLASSTNEAELSIYGALRSSDGALTLIVINKTTSAIQTSVSLAHFTPGPSAATYRYSESNLQQISALGNISITPAGFSYDFPAYSATVFVAAVQAQTSTSVSIAGPSEIREGGTAQYSALVNGAPVAVQWSVNGVVGGKASSGLISTSGVYVPSTSIWAGHSVTVSASLPPNPGPSASLSVKILNPLPVFASGSVTQTTPGSTFLLDVLGSGFVAGTQLQVAGADVVTTFVSSGEVKSTLTLPAGTATIAVGIINPDAAQKSPVVRHLPVQVAPSA
jgi:Glycoside hydrolase family 44